MSYLNIFHRVKKINLIAITTDAQESDVPCGECTACCQLLAPHLTPEEITSGKYPLSLSNEGLNGPVVTIFRKREGGCGMFIDGKCSIYQDRPLACRQFDCRKGHHPKTNEIAMKKFGVIPDEVRENSSIHYIEE